MDDFDYYRPDPELICPVCDHPLFNWHGTDGPCAFLTWFQGRQAPRLHHESQPLRSSVLPEQFLISTGCCSPRFDVEAVCRSEHGVWTSCDITTAATAQRRQGETRSEFEERLRWLETPPSEARLLHLQNWGRYFSHHAQTEPSFEPEVQAASAMIELLKRPGYSVQEALDVVNALASVEHYDGSGWHGFELEVCSVLSRDSTDFDVVVRDGLLVMVDMAETKLGSRSGAG